MRIVPALDISLIEGVHKNDKLYPNFRMTHTASFAFIANIPTGKVLFEVAFYREIW